MRAQISVLLFCLFTANIFSQNMYVSGQIVGFDHQVILLQDFSGHRSRTLDSVLTDGEGRFQFGVVKNVYRGQYRLVLKADDEEIIHFLSADDSIVIKADYHKYASIDYSFTKGIENILLKNYLNQRNDLRSKERSVDELLQFVYKPSDTFYKKLHKELARLEKEGKKAFANLKKNTEANSQVRAYADVFEYFNWRNIMARSYDGCANFWGDFDLSDEAYFRSNFLFEIIPNHFADCVIDGNDDVPEQLKMQMFVDSIMKAFAANKPLKEAAIDYLLIGFEQAGSVEMMEYIINTYVVGDGCEVEERFPSITDKIAKNRQLQPGAWAQNLTLTNANGQKVTFDASIEQKQLLVFWSSSCPHCMEEMPILGSALAVLQTQNIALYTVALEVYKSEWLAALEQNKLTTYGNHVSELKGWDGSATETYPILSLPAIFIIQNGKIAGKYRSIEEAVQTIQAR